MAAPAAPGRASICCPDCAGLARFQTRRPPTIAPSPERAIGLGRIVALYYYSSTLYHIH